jgi:hypothetical protein
MRITMVCFLAFLFFMVIISGLFAQDSLNYCPIDSSHRAIKASPPPQPTPPFSKVYTVPRKQVLLEIGTDATG